MLIHKLDNSEVSFIQEQQGAFYWSGCCENLFRKHGVIPWDGEERADRAALHIYPREAARGEISSGAFLEGPLSKDLLRTLGLIAHTRAAPTLRLHLTPERMLTVFEYPKAVLFAKDPKTGARGEPYSYVPADRRYHKEVFAFQTFEPTAEWVPVLFGSECKEDKLLPVAVSDGRRLVLGIPILDLLCALMAWPPLPDGYYQMGSELPSTALESWLIASLRDLALANGSQWLRIGAWPHGYKWACTVRSDYDRPITDSQIRRLLAFYADQGLRATWCFLAWNCPPHQSRLLAHAGHEIALHTGARSQQDFNSEIASITRETGISLRGVTSHGGDYIGFIGDLQYKWAEEAGMSYGEAIGRVSRFPYRVLRIVDDQPAIGKLMLMSTHSSLDAGTGPQQHYLDRVLAARKSIINQGGHFVFMNHPDLHGEQVYTALLMDGLARPWSATFSEMQEWTTSSKYDVALAPLGRETEVKFGQPLQHDCSIEISSAAGTKGVRVRAGTKTFRV